MSQLRTLRLEYMNAVDLNRAVEHLLVECPPSLQELQLCVTRHPGISHGPIGRLMNARPQLQSGGGLSHPASERL